MVQFQGCFFSQDLQLTDRVYQSLNPRANCLWRGKECIYHHQLDERVNILVQQFWIEHAFNLLSQSSSISSYSYEDNTLSLCKYRQKIIVLITWTGKLFEMVKRSFLFDNKQSGLSLDLPLCLIWFVTVDEEHLYARNTCEHFYFQCQWMSYKLMREKQIKIMDNRYTRTFISHTKSLINVISFQILPCRTRNPRFNTATNNRHKTTNINCTKTTGPLGPFLGRRPDSRRMWQHWQTRTNRWATSRTPRMPCRKPTTH